MKRTEAKKKKKLENKRCKKTTTRGERARKAEYGEVVGVEGEGETRRTDVKELPVFIA